MERTSVPGRAAIFPSHPPRPGRKKTGPKPTFTREDVVEAALSIGIGTFTLSEVAKKVGVATSAVYRVFRSRDEVVHACMEHCAKTVDLDITSMTPWDEVLRRWGTRLWAVCDEYPGLDVLLFTLPGVFVHVRRTINKIIGTLVKQGFSERDALLAFDLVGDTVIVTHIGRSTLKRMNENGTSAFDEVLAEVGEEDYYRPEVTTFDPEFLHEKIELIIDAVRKRQTPPAGGDSA